jgi:hypothetical protein
MTDDIATLLERAAPITSEADAIRAELRSLAYSTRRATRPYRRRRLLKVGIPTLSVALVVGGVTTAAADPSVQGWWTDHVAVALPWASGPSACVDGVGVESDPQEPADPVALAAAKTYLHQIDFSQITSTDEYKKLAAEAVAAAAAIPDTDPLKSQYATLFRYDALSNMVGQTIVKRLRSEGVDTAGIVITGDEHCGRDSR